MGVDKRWIPRTIRLRVEGGGGEWAEKGKHIFRKLRNNRLLMSKSILIRVAENNAELSAP